MRQRPYRFLIYYGTEDDDPEAISTESYTTDITGLTPGTEYFLRISTVLHGEQSKPIEASFFTDSVHSKIQLTGALPESKLSALSRVWTFYTVAPGKAQNMVQLISTWLKERHMKEEESPEECDFILAVCPIVSRLAIDVETIQKMIPGSHPAILVVVHHTFRPDYVVPDSKKFLRRSDILLVDLLFDEDKGFLHLLPKHSMRSKESGGLEWSKDMSGGVGTDKTVRRKLKPKLSSRRAGMYLYGDDDEDYDETPNWPPPPPPVEAFPMVELPNPTFRPEAAAGDNVLERGEFLSVHSLLLAPE
ncbi:uncharacterized protein LOC134060475 [Sardina pilchardus]|uniref:uncharacterized protein LOC134060475 n=1 Tax=Sardina pilchardus TaxID=27697 RepID=UPI002E0E62FE